MGETNPSYGSVRYRPRNPNPPRSRKADSTIVVWGNDRGKVRERCRRKAKEWLNLFRTGGGGDKNNNDRGWLKANFFMTLYLVVVLTAVITMYVFHGKL